MDSGLPPPARHTLQPLLPSNTKWETCRSPYRIALIIRIPRNGLVADTNYTLITSIGLMRMLVRRASTILAPRRAVVVLRWLRTNRPFSSESEESPLASLPARVRVAAHAVSDALSALGVTHAIAGGVACHAHGHRRATEDVDLLVNADDARGAVFSFFDNSPGYSPRFRGSRRSWRDTKNRVDIDLLVSGDFPGDGLPKPVVFPVLTPLGPSQSHDWYTRVIGGLRFVDLVTLIELKLASALTAPHRLKDAADVQALIAANALPREFAVELHVSVRPEYVRLWGLVDEQHRLGLQ